MYFIKKNDFYLDCKFVRILQGFSLLRFSCVFYFLFCNFNFSFSHGACTSCSPIFFKENKNQWDNRIKYKAEFKAGDLMLEKSGFTYMLYDTADLMRYAAIHHHKKVATSEKDFQLHYHVLKSNFINANSNPSILTDEKIDEYFNYYLGKNPAQWASKVNAFKTILYNNLYENIDLKVYSSEGFPKYDYIVKPNAEPKKIQWKLEGAEKIYIKNGALIIQTSVGEMLESKPYAYQLIGGQKTEVVCKFEIEKNVIHFEMPNDYDHSKELVIDPTLIFSTFSGSVADNFGYTATYDGHGNAFSAGSVFHFSNWSYPTTAGAFQTSWAGGIGYNAPWNGSGTGTDIGITKYDSAGLHRIYSTYLGGDHDELPHSMIVNASNQLIVFGTTGSDNFPVTPNAFDTSFNGGINPGIFGGIAVHYSTGSDIFITRFNYDGTALIGSTYMGGSGNDGLNYPISQYLNYNYADEVRGEVEVDENDNIIVASCSNSSDFPISSQTFQPTFNGGNMDGVVFKLNSTLSQLIWSTYLGGSLDDAAYSIAFDKNKNLYVSGGTRSPNFPVTIGTIEPNFNGGRSDGFIAHLDKYGKNLLHGTYYGSPAYDQTYFVETNKQGGVYVLGQTDVHDSTYIKNSLYNQFNSGQFITKLSPNLDSIEWSNTFGRGLGKPDISPTAFLVDLCNKIYVSGWGSDFSSFGYGALGTAGLPVSSNAYQPTTDSNDFYLFVMEDDASLLNYATYFGSPNTEEHVDGGTSRFDKKGVCYQAVCAGCGGLSSFPTYPANTVSTTNNSYNCNNAIFKFDFNLPFILADFERPPSGCAPVSIHFIDKSKTYLTTTYFWSFGDGATSILPNPSHTYSQPGIYTVTLALFDAQSCNLRDTIQRQIVILKSTRDTLPTQIVCKNGVVQIGFPSINDTSIHFIWTPTATLSDTNITNPVAIPDTNTTYILYASNKICVDTFYQRVVIFPLSFDVAKDSAYCVLDSSHILIINKENIQNLSFTWSPKSLILHGDSTLSVTVKTPVDTTFRVKIKGGPGCVLDTSIFVNVIHDSLFAARFSLPISNCLPSAIIPLDSSILCHTTKYFWSLNDSLVSTLTSPIIQGVKGGIYTVKLILIDTVFCYRKDSAVQQTLVLDHKKDTLPNFVVCKNGSQQIGVQPFVSNSISYSWSPSSGLSNPQIANPISTPNHSTKYQLFVNNGLCVDTFIQSVFVFDDEIKVGYDSFPCPKDTLQLFVLNNLIGQNLSYSWSPNSLIVNGQGTSMANALPNLDTIFYVQVQNNLGCSKTDSIHVNVVKNKIVKANFIQPSSGCFPLNTNFVNTSAVVGNPSYHWSFGDGSTSNLRQPSHTFLTAGIFSVKLLVYDSLAYCNPLDSIIKLVTVVNNRDSFNIPNDTICKGNSIRLGNIAGVDSTYTFSWMPTNFLSNASVQNPLCTPDSSISYIVNVSKNGCTFFYKERVEIDFDKIKLISDTAFCPNDTLFLSVQNSSPLPLTYHWNPKSFIIKDSLTANPWVLANSDTEMTVIGINKFGCIFKDSIRIHSLVENVLKANFTPPASHCVPFNALFSNTSNYLANTHFTWNFGDGSTSTLLNPTHTYLSGGVYFVKLVLHDSSSCNLIDSITQKIILLDHKTDSLPSKLICANQTVQIGIDSLVDNTLHFSWNPTSFLSNSSIANPLATPLLNTNYQLIISNSFCTDTFLQAVNLINKSFVFSQDLPTCPQDSLHVFLKNTTNQIGVTYQWSPANFILHGQNSNQVTVRIPRDTFIYVLITSAQCSFKDSFYVTVLDEEQVHADFNTPPIGCIPYTAQFINKSLVKGNATYTWDFGDNSPKSNAIDPFHTYQNAGNYFVTLIVKDTAFKCKKIDTIQKQISVSKNNQLDTLPTKILCKGSSIQIGFLGSNQGVSYQWTPILFLNNDTISNPICSANATAWYELNVQTSNCKHLYRQQVQVVDDSVWIEKKDNSCTNPVVVMTAVNKDGVDSLKTFLWSPSNQILNGQNQPQITLKPASNILVYLEVTDKFGCKYFDTAYAAIHNDLANLHASANPSTIRWGDSSQLNINSTEPFSSFWLEDSTLTNPKIPNPKAFPKETTTYYAQLMDTFKCYKTDSVTVTVERTQCPDAVFFVPNAFTPNGDGKNDVLYVRGYNLLSIHFAVFDRWGQKMFETTDISKGWDGTFQGAKLDPAVFGYYLEGVCVGNERFLKKGNVTILK